MLWRLYIENTRCVFLISSLCQNFLLDDLRDFFFFLGGGGVGSWEGGGAKK